MIDIIKFRFFCVLEMLLINGQGLFIFWLFLWLGGPEALERSLGY